MAEFPQFTQLPFELQHIIFSKCKNTILSICQVSKHIRNLTADLYLKQYNGIPISQNEIFNYIKTKPKAFALLYHDDNIAEINGSYYAQIFDSNNSSNNKIITTSIDLDVDLDTDIGINPIELVNKYLGPTQLPITIKRYDSLDLVTNTPSYFEAWMYIRQKKWPNGEVNLYQINSCIEYNTIKIDNLFILTIINLINDDTLYAIDLISCYQIYKQRLGCMVREPIYAVLETISRLYIIIYGYYKTYFSIQSLLYVYNFLYIEAILHNFTNKGNVIKFITFFDVIIFSNTDLVNEYYHTNPLKYQAKINMIKEQVEDWYQQAYAMITMLM